MRILRLFMVATLLSCALGTLYGCSKKSKPESAKKVALKVPDSVMFYTGTDQPNTLLTALHGVATQVTPLVPDPKLMVGPLLQGRFSLAAPTAFDFDKPLRVILVNPKTDGRDPSATIVGIKDVKSFEGVIPATDKTQNADGNAWMYRRWKGAKYPVYLNFINNHVVITRHKDLFAQNKTFISDLLAEPFAGGGGAVARVEQAAGVFDAEIKTQLAQIKTQLKALPADQGGTGMVTMADALEKNLRDIRSLTARLDITKDGIRIGTFATPKPKSALAGTFAGLKSGSHSFLDRAPKDTMGYLSMALETASFQSLLKQSSGLMELFTQGQSLGKAGQEAIGKYSGQLDGRMLLAAHGEPGGSGVAISAMYGSKDIKAMRAAAAEAQQAVKAIGTAAQTAGVSTDFKQDAYTVEGHPVDTITISSTNPQMAALAMTGMNVQHMAYLKDHVTASYGPTAKAVLEQHAKGEYKGLKGNPEIQRGLTNAAPNAFLHAYVSRLQLMKSVKLGGMNPFAVTLAGVQAQSGIFFSAGHESGSMHFALEIPVNLLKEGMAAFERVKGSF